MKFVITLGDAVELAFVALVLVAFAMGVVVKWWRERGRLTPPAETGKPKGETNGEV